MPTVSYMLFHQAEDLVIGKMLRFLYSQNHHDIHIKGRSWVMERTREGLVESLATFDRNIMFHVLS